MPVNILLQGTSICVFKHTQYWVIPEMPKKIPDLPRATIWVDSRGRVTILEYLRNALGLHEGGWLELEAYPSLDDCKALILKKT